VETYEQMLVRAGGLLEGLREAHADETVLLCGHGGINYAILAVVTGRSFAETRAAIGMDNTSVCLLEGSAGTLAVTAANDTSHLGAEGST
jgi:broad specificity phosphatase PhoE